MSVAKNWRIPLALWFAGCVAADGEDDYSNNLFSDLAPLLALFGERVTMQFMSQSMGWADNFILAMAPIGIITVIVSAIRVGGPSWLKAIIGRARENLAVAEADLMSSTSKEVCELWNGRQVVRCMGSAPVSEFICLLPSGTQSSGKGLQIDARLETINVDDAVEKGYLEKFETNLWDCIMHKIHWNNPASDSKEEKGQATSNHLDPEIIIVRNTAADAPNVSLNSHSQFGRGELRAVAVIGTLLQLGALTYSGFAAYYPTLKLAKGGRPVADYAFPCTAAGTLTLVAALKTIVGTVVNLCGFVVQFIGLRGMHWSASIAQLGAALVMTGLRAWVRRGLAKPPQCERLTPGFELEWFATTLRDVDSAPWWPTTPESVGKLVRIWRMVTGGGPTTHGKQVKEVIKDWRIVTGENPIIHGKLVETREDEDASQRNDGKGTAHTVVRIRRDLGRLADWRGPASAEAVSLARAIEVTMDTLLSPPHTNNLTWSLRAHNAGWRAQSVKFRLQHDGTWKASADEIEAALSLWVYSVSETKRRQNEEKQGQSEPPRTKSHKGDAWLRAKGSSAELSLRILGLSTPALLRDLRWWMPSDAPRILEIEEDNGGELEVENHRVVGSDPQRVDIIECEQGGRTRYKSREPNFDLGNLLYAQDMFTAFMWAAAKTLKDPIKGGAEIRPDNTSSANAWQSFTLRNAQLSKMAQDIQSTGLGSLYQIYQSIIPPFSAQQKLPQADAIVELARQHAKEHERLRHWKDAGDVYLWLFRAAKTFPEESSIATRATAVLMEYLRTVTPAIELKEAQHYEERDIRDLKGVKLELEKELKTVDFRILSSIMGLYEEQGRGWECVPLKEAGFVREDKFYPDVFNFTRLHELAASGDFWKLKGILEENENVNPKDIHYWTPLHYAAAARSVEMVEALLQRRADVNPRDLLEWTPLHYACQCGRAPIVQVLLREGAELDAHGRDGMTPLLCAAMNGHLDVVRSLIEAGAALDVPDMSGNTPLLWAAFKGHKGVVEYLWQDANKKLRDHTGRTALHLAAMAGRVEVVMQLVELGADKEAKERSGWTPLHLAARNRHVDAVRLLIELGADKQAKDSNGRTPLDLAASSGYLNVERLLIELAADKEAKDGNGWTPRDLDTCEGLI
ncbi:hypothetical protein DL769_004695 [Monosporascus sp. CRB-8-3]|nr:hypothetical protein DL769_004695 [Monosporascus sp. CRB-8-3]